ncbi:unnamed protein product [Owenia fusiformis]|uniref:Uncharacterized protein n=1 Tax=Owenia fusiformis TaxID=6347 RepID=A0A8J1Y3N4_OWEFU|nr:unnamed protein product [Owenia fusiformis]
MSVLEFIMGNTLAKTAAIDFTIQWAGWLVAVLMKTEKFYDLVGACTHLYLAYKSLEWSGKTSTRKQVQTGMVMTWAFRLGLFLFTRILKEGKDRRFNQIKQSPAMFLFAWTMQGAWIFLNLLPTLIHNSKEKDKPISTRDYVGWGLWTVGFLFEVIADYQKSSFRNNPDNAGKFISSGLWSICRHPNYFGEILLWCGLYISASSTFKGKEYLSAISPLFTFFLLTRVSGIPMLEKSGLRRWGKDPSYLEYLKNTPSLIPFFR